MRRYNYGGIRPSCDPEHVMRKFDSLSEREILALAISLEEEDERVYADYAEGLRKNLPRRRHVRRMGEEEAGHRRRLIELYRQRFGTHIPLIRRQDVSGFVRESRSGWAGRSARNSPQAGRHDGNGKPSVLRAGCGPLAGPGTRQLLDDLAGEERSHENRAEELEKEKLGHESAQEEDEAEPPAVCPPDRAAWLAGLMDGSVSTLAPVFAAAFATNSSRDAFVVGLAASLGAGISMGFAEALSDDGSLTGRGHPWIRGLVCGLMTALGGIGHTLPFLIPDFRVAMTAAIIVVVSRTGGDRVDSQPLHGYSAAFGSVAGGPGGLAGFCYRVLIGNA